MSLQWLIVGGGIHGVHIAARLIGEAGVDRSKIRIIDPGENLLERWQSCTEVTGMTHLRSPSVHNLAIEPMSLSFFGESLNIPKSVLYAPPYDRPHLNFFNEHCSRVIGYFGLEELHIRGLVVSCSVTCEEAIVEVSTGEKISSDNVVLAIGAGDQPMWPEWSKGMGDLVHHIFHSGFSGWPIKEERIAVVGGGISAGQVALRLQDEGHEVHLVSRHEMKEHQFDSDPGWLGPKYMAGFEKEKDLSKRRQLISGARHRGSVPPDVNHSLTESIGNGGIKFYESGVSSIDKHQDSANLNLADGTSIQIDRVLLATGFMPKRPGGKMVDQLITESQLPCAECGYPIVDTDLCWHPRLYVSGPLAELEIGPSSRNISGARRAAKRIVRVARKKSIEVV